METALQHVFWSAPGPWNEAPGGAVGGVDGGEGSVQLLHSRGVLQDHGVLGHNLQLIRAQILHTHRR